MTKCALNEGSVVSCGVTTVGEGGVYAFRIASTPSGLRRNEAKSNGIIGDSPLSKEDTDMIE